MKTLQDMMSEVLQQAFIDAGYEDDGVRVIASNRPDLCAYQCNAAMALAKRYHKNPKQIADEVLSHLAGDIFSFQQVVAPGFINLDVSDDVLTNYIQDVVEDEHLGMQTVTPERPIIIDYGGANVAKPLHVGHLRSAVIGEAIKRMLQFSGEEVIGDVHLGDWGLQMGLIITQLEQEQPNLPYFDHDHTGPYPTEPPFDIAELERIYPVANARSKEDANFKERAREATVRLQQGDAGYRALWEHILSVSIADLKRNYDRLNVHFEWWKKESDAQPYISDMIDYLKDNDYTRVSEGALVVDVKREDDTKEIPPCMILKSDGGTLYNTTDLATIVERRKLVNPKRLIYVVDKRQSLYFEQVFRCAKKTKLLADDVELNFLGFGTMNGKDGKPFKTRDGGVMRLQSLLDEIQEKMYQKMQQGDAMPQEEARKTAEQIALSSIKYGDLSNQASKDYVFDIDRFTSFEGETGPYILYTIVRIGSILQKAEVCVSSKELKVPTSDAQRELYRVIARCPETLKLAVDELAPHRICRYLYELSNAFNHFYHETKILTEPNEVNRQSYLALCQMTAHILQQLIDLLGFSAPERM